MKNAYAALLSVMLVACSGDQVYEIADAEHIGFEKTDQMFFELIGATDGWNGTLEGDSVELFRYENVSDAKDAFSRLEEQYSDYEDFCRVGNLIMASYKGDSACAALKRI